MTRKQKKALARIIISAAALAVCLLAENMFALPAWSEFVIFLILFYLIVKLLLNIGYNN